MIIDYEVADHIYIVCGSSRDRFKALYWDADGFYLLYKRLENGVFQWPRTSKELKELSPEAFHLLLTGFSSFPSINPAKTGSIF